MTTRLLIATLLLAAMPVVGAAQTRPEPPKPARIVVNDSGGAMQSAMRRFFYDDFEKRYGIKVVNTSPVDLPASCGRWSRPATSNGR
jgi:putative spermidine/putrescine transport system substrate-binding protein